jgi:hypothetical protein
MVGLRIDLGDDVATGAAKTKDVSEDDVPSTDIDKSDNGEKWLLRLTSYEWKSEDSKLGRPQPQQIQDTFEEPRASYTFEFINRQSL